MHGQRRRGVGFYPGWRGGPPTWIDTAEYGTPSANPSRHPAVTNPNDYQEKVGALGAIRTPDPQIRSLMLYPAELRAHIAASARRRNLVAGGGQFKAPGAAFSLAPHPAAT